MRSWNYTLTGEPDLFADRGFTGHEYLEDFKLYNMNGRLYDPVVGRFLSPDPFVQSPDFTQNFNRYSYGLNNPLVYVDEDGEWLWLVFAVYGAWNLGVRAGVAAENNGGHFWNGFWKGAIVGFSTGALASFAPLGTEWAGSTIWGATVGTAGMAGGIWAMGGNDYSNLWKGTATGGLMGFLSSEQFVNMVRGQGFRSNDKVLANFVSKGRQQDALEYFGFKGTYDPEHKMFQKYGDEPAFTDTKTGEIFYNNSPFESNFDRLKFVANHEMKHSQNVLSGKYLNIKITPEIQGSEEWSTYLYNYKNQGLYTQHGIDIISRINHYGLQVGIYDIIVTPTGTDFMQFNKKWWHFLYTIPRRW